MQNFTFQESSPLTAIIRNKAEEPIIRGIESSVLVRVPYGDLIGSRQPLVYVTSHLPICCNICKSLKMGALNLFKQNSLTIENSWSLDARDANNSNFSALFFIDSAWTPYCSHFKKNNNNQRCLSVLIMGEIPTCAVPVCLHTIE